MSVFDGVDSILDSWLGLNSDADRFGIRSPKYAAKSAAIALAERQGPLRDDLPQDWGSELIAACLNQMESNLDTVSIQNVPGSNWEWKKSLHLAIQSTSEEKILEKIAAFLLDDNWMNQMPVCNGLHGKGRANACRIDLVRRTDNTVYDLIELKYSEKEHGGCNHPLYAAMEILKYGLVYILFRKCALLSHTSPRHHILDATQVRLVVLAPPAWYCYGTRSGDRLPFQFRWLEQALTIGLTEAAKSFVPELQKTELVFEEMTPAFITLYQNLRQAVDTFRGAKLDSRPVSFNECGG